MTSPLSTGLQGGSRSIARSLRADLVGPVRLGEEEISLTIADVRLALSGLSPSLKQTLVSRFRLFVSNTRGEQAEDLRIRVHPAVVKGYLALERQGGKPQVYRLETRAHEGRLHVWSYAFAGWFEIEGTQGEVNLCDSPVEPPERSIENFLRVAFSWKASRRGGFLLHASGLVRRGRAYLFFGPSGSGKTTVARLSGSDLLLNDDCIYVRKESGRFVASGVPFKGIEAGGAQRTGAFPIAGLFRLVQSRRVYSEPIGPARAVAELAASMPYVSERTEGLEGSFKTIEELVRSVRVGRLHFRLAPDFWSAIEEPPRG